MGDAPETTAVESPAAAPPHRRRWLYVLIPLGAIAVVVAAVVAWGLTPLGPSDSALAALESGSWVMVTPTSYGWRFQPQSTTPSSGVVLYPGGHVDPRSYAPLARAIASRGHVVAVLKAPLSLVVLSPDAADAPIVQETGVTTWVVGGHSLGGVTAATYASEHPGTVSGLLLLAAYPAEKTDLSSTRLAAASIVGTDDGVLDTAAWEAARTRLPPDTEIVRIPGGNHSQFGSYGLQPGDNAAETSETSQIDAIAGVAQRVIERAASGGGE